MDLAVREQINMKEESLCVGPTNDTHTKDVIQDIILPIVAGVLIFSIVIPFVLGSLCVSISLIKDIIALF